MSDTPDRPCDLSRIFDEFLVRRQRGESPSLDEYCQRFPDLAGQLRLHVGLYDALGEVGPARDDPASGPGEDAHAVALLPGLKTVPPDEAIPWPHPAGLPYVPGYEVETVLGRGGMGVVYKARHLALKRTVALKMVAGGYPYPAEQARFRAEAEAVAKLQHPNIVQIHEIGEADGQPFFALEYVAGGSLAERLAGQFLPACTAARLVATLAEAMHLAHSRNLIHRDLKPANVLLVGGADTEVDQCQPKVTDFGLVRQLDADSSQTCDGMVLGTPSYMAPEQAAGRAGSAGPAADVYALGAILYECLTGRPPFVGATAQETLEQVRGREPAPPTSLNPRTPRDLETICLKCLRKEPERRYSSARELADDLGRFVRGEPVAAHPVGRLERVAKWIRRNPTVATLSAVAALALVAGTVVSLVFGVEASRRAAELQVQTLAAQENARLAKENEEKTGQMLVSGLLIPIGRDPRKLTFPVDAGEAYALRQLRAISPSLRRQFLETALRDRETARRVGRRADWVVQAIVGGDRALRAEVTTLVVQRIQEPDAPPEARFACARLGLAVHVTDRAWAEHSADALLVALRDPQTEQLDFLWLAEALAAVCEQLPPTQAADHAAAALDLFLTLFRNTAYKQIDHMSLGRGIAAISPWLDPATAARAAKTLTAHLCQPDCVPFLWTPLSTALVAVCRRLPASEADAHVNRTIDFLIAGHNTTNEVQRSNYTWLTMALGELCGRLDPARASRVAHAIIAILGDSRMVGDYRSENFSRGNVAVLTEVAKWLDPPGGLRAAEDLVLVLRKATSILLAQEELRVAVVALCRRLDAAGAARVAEAMTAAARDPKTSMLVRTVFADAFALIASQLTPAVAASLEGTLVDALLVDLGETKPRYYMGNVGKALGTASGRPGATSAARVAEALAAAIGDPQTPVQTLEQLSAALVVVCAQLPSHEASSRVHATTDVLESLWNARTKTQDRASIATGQMAVWTHLDRADAAARARRAVACLDGALRDPKLASHEIFALVRALSALYAYLDPTERLRHANASADTLVAVLRNHRNEVITSSALSQALATMSTHMDRPAVVSIADTVFALMDDSNIQPGGPGSTPFPQLDRFVMYEKLFNKVAVRLEERDLQRLLAHPLAVGNVQRTLLDALPGSQQRSFRNIWDYLDDPEAHGKGPDVLAPGTNRNR